MGSINDSELLRALEELVSAQKDPEGFLSMRDWIKATGLSDRTLKKRFGMAKDLGRLAVARVYREGIDGRMMAVSGYRILSAKQ